MELKKRQQLLFSVCIGILSSIILSSILYFNINVAYNRYTERERIAVLERFIQFKSSAEAIINENTNLLKGYLAYFYVNPNMSEIDSNRYLEKLLDNDTGIIRNIGIIKDTTIIWTYPKQSNLDAIGVDLAKIPSQEKDVLKVKQSLEPLFTGPVDLIQGGQGFIISLPITISKEYWGQIGIVLDADKYMDQLTKLANEEELNIAIYNVNNYPNNPFFGECDIADGNKNALNFEILNNKWVVVAEPLHGWKEREVLVNGAKLLTIIISVIVGIFIFILTHTRFRLKNQVMNDHLTGVHTRNYLTNYYNMIVRKAELNNELIGVFLLDINSFKSVNDNYGHKVGDMVLIAFAKGLQSIKIKNKKVFRLGGDEFLITISGYKDLEGLQYIENKIRAESTVHFKYENIDMDIISSIGFAAYPNDGKTLDQIMHIADLKMYEEKKEMKK